MEEDVDFMQTLEMKVENFYVQVLNERCYMASRTKRAY